MTTMTTGWRVEHDPESEFILFSSPLTLIVLEALSEHSFNVLCSRYLDRIVLPNNI